MVFCLALYVNWFWCWQHSKRNEHLLFGSLARKSCQLVAGCKHPQPTPTVGLQRAGWQRPEMAAHEFYTLYLLVLSFFLLLPCCWASLISSPLNVASVAAWPVTLCHCKQTRRRAVHLHIPISSLPFPFGLHPTLLLMPCNNINTQPFQWCFKIIPIFCYLCFDG